MNDLVDQLRREITRTVDLDIMHQEAADEIERLHKEIDAMGAAISAALPYCYYMDPPDGGNVELSEQLRRMGEDAARYRWLRENGHEAIGGDRGMGPEWTYYDALDALVDAAMKGQ